MPSPEEKLTQMFLWGPKISLENSKFSVIVVQLWKVNTPEPDLSTFSIYIFMLDIFIFMFYYCKTSPEIRTHPFKMKFRFGEGEAITSPFKHQSF